ncbi:MAG: hypothetical protein ACHQ53_02710 [Polyangiales bacterium]
MSTLSPRERAWLPALLLLGLASGPVRHARAFSDAEGFGKPVEAGGGGGRWFTGSATDGFTCGVCHHGGQSPDLSIFGLPLKGYTPGTAYEITIDWPGDIENVAFTAEVADRAGQRAGGIRLPPDDELLDSELCAPVEAHIGAGEVMELDTRTVLSVPDCGSRRSRFLWTAPVKDVGPVWFSGSLVASNAQGNLDGDGVRDFAHVIGSPSARDPLASRIASGCSVRPNARGNPWLVCASLGLVLALRRRLRSKR